jgi:hypothetical protein
VNPIERIADTIKADLEQRLPNQRKTQRGKLSLLVATMLDVRSANLMDLAHGLGRRIVPCDRSHGYALPMDCPLSRQ